MKNITVLVAHPDDEVIFGWPVLKDAKKIICCANDLNHPRMWGKDRKEAFLEIGKLIGAEVVCLDNNCDFRLLGQITGEFNKFAKQVNEAIKNEDVIFTHNGWGEYGHIDHILVHAIAKNTGKRIIVTDIVVDLGWFPVRGWDLGKPFADCNIDYEFYNKCKEIYVKHGCWTWHTPDIEKARLYYV